MSETIASTPGGISVSSKGAWRALVVLLIGMFMALLDATIVNVALPSIRTELSANEATLSWIISGYALAFGLALIPAGRLGDRYGHKWIFIIGLTLFTAASLACGIAQDSTQLIVARVVQGLAGGLFLPAVTAFIQILFPGKTRGKAFAIMGAVIGVSSALGPIAGGLLIQGFGEKTGWRYVFDVNLPIGIVAVVLAIALLPSGSVSKARSGGVDGVGLLLVTAGLVGVLVPLIEGQSNGWPAWTYLTLAAGVVMLVLFGLWERAYTKRGNTPLVPPHLFSHPAFTGGTILALVYFAAFTSIFFTISLLWQTGLGHTALESGLVSVPFAVGSIVGSSQSNRLAGRLGRRVLVLGTALVVLGLAVVWLLLFTVNTEDLTNWILLAPLLVAGVGNGLFIAPNAQFIVATVDPQEAGSASGVIATMQRVGSAIGIAVIGSVLFGTLVVAKPTASQIAEAGQKYGATGAAAIKRAIQTIVEHNLATGFGTSAALAMLVSAVFALAAFLLVFTLPKKVSRGWDSEGAKPGGQPGSEPGSARPGSEHAGPQHAGPKHADAH